MAPRRTRAPPAFRIARASMAARPRLGFALRRAVCSSRPRVALASSRSTGPMRARPESHLAGMARHPLVGVRPLAPPPRRRESRMGTYGPTAGSARPTAGPGWRTDSGEKTVIADASVGAPRPLPAAEARLTGAGAVGRSGRAARPEPRSLRGNGAARSSRDRAVLSGRARGMGLAALRRPWARRSPSWSATWAVTHIAWSPPNTWPRAGASAAARPTGCWTWRRSSAPLAAWREPRRGPMPSVSPRRSPQERSGRWSAGPCWNRNFSPKLGADGGTSCRAAHRPGHLASGVCLATAARPRYGPARPIRGGPESWP